MLFEGQIGGKRPSKWPEIKTQLTESLRRSTPQLSFCRLLPPVHTHTYKECVRGIHICPKLWLHGPEMEKPACVMEKQIKRQLRAGFHPRQITSLLWWRKEAGQEEDKVRPVFLTLLPSLPPFILLFKCGKLFLSKICCDKFSKWLYTVNDFIFIFHTYTHDSRAMLFFNAF